MNDINSLEQIINKKIRRIEKELAPLEAEEKFDAIGMLILRSQLVVLWDLKKEFENEKIKTED